MKIKKILMFVILPLICMLFMSNDSRKNKSVPYAIKCYKCIEGKTPYTHAPFRSIANRSFKDEYNDNGYEGYCIYKCEHGHILYVNYTTGDKK